MARRTFDGIDAELLLRISNRSDVTAAMRAQFINDAYVACANAYEHVQIQSDATETLVAATDSITPSATDIWWPEWVFNVTMNVPVYQDSLDRIEAQIKTTRPPSKYMWRNSKFVFDSKPAVSQSIRIFYVRTLVELSTGLTSVLDRVFDQYIIIKAAIIAYQTVRDFKESTIQEAQLNNYLAPLNLPLRKAKLNDKGQGFKVKMR